MKHSTSRRAALGALAAAAALPAGIGISNPGAGAAALDSELIRACDAACRLWTDADARACVEDWSDARMDANTAAVISRTERAAALPASTPAGLRAKARLVAQYFAPDYPGQPRDFAERLLDSLLRDLIGQGGRA